MPAVALVGLKIVFHSQQGRRIAGMFYQGVFLASPLVDAAGNHPDVLPFAGDVLDAAGEAVFRAIQLVFRAAFSGGYRVDNAVAEVATKGH